MRPPDAGAAAEPATGSADPHARAETDLQEELRRTRDLLESTTETHDQTVAELQTVNVELQSINEEQKAATEELETGREEIQSINEELTTINQEHQSTIEELKRTNEDLQNLIGSTINLCGNAVKYTETGEVRVRMRRAPRGVVFEISDTGIGIAAEHLTRIFERFWQVDGGSTRAGGGMSIGLAAAREYARLLQGDVEVASTPGSGTTFKLWLPPEYERREGLRRTTDAEGGGGAPQVALPVSATPPAAGAP